MEEMVTGNTLGLQQPDPLLKTALDKIVADQGGSDLNLSRCLCVLVRIQGGDCCKCCCADF